MAFSADTMAVTLALAKKYANTSIANSLTGVKSIEPDPTKTKLIVTTMDDQVFEIDIQQTFTAEQIELINRMSIINDELAFDGVVIEGLTPEQSALLVSFNDHIQNFSNPHKTRISNLTDVEIDTPIDGQVIMLEDGKYKNKTLNIPTDGKVKMEDGSPSKFLSEQIDGTTISKNETNTLSAIGLKGMDTSIPELNYISGLDEPIMTKFAKFGNGNIEVYKTVFPTYVNLIQFDFTTLMQGTTFLMYVSTDETHQDLGTIYLCDNGTNNSDNPPSYAGLSSAPQRDFSVDKINLETEVKGVLPKTNMDLNGLATSTELLGYMSKDVYDPNNDGVVNSAETLKGLTKTPQELNKDIGIDAIKAGNNITLEKDEVNNTVTINSSSGGGGGSSVAPSEINGNIINNGEQMVVYDDSQIQTDIASLDNRSVVGKIGQTYFAIGNSGTTSVSPTTNMATILTNFSTNMATTNGFIMLEKGVKYKINFYVYKQSVGSSDAIRLSMKDMSGNTLIDNGYIPSTNFTGIPLEYTTDFMTKDTLVGFYLDKTVNINPAFSCISIEEISRTYTLDPVEYAQDHEVKYGTFHITSNKTLAPETPLVFDTSYGTMKTTDEGYIQLYKGKTYMISASVYQSSSVVRTSISLYDVTSSTPNLVYLGINGESTGSVSFTPTEDVVVSLETGKQMLLDYRYTYLTIQEIKNPVIVEYTNIKEISNPLMSSQISQEAPIGTVIDYLGDDVPNYYLLCDGTIYNIQDYQELFNRIGNKYGGDGVTNFAVPNITLTNGKSYIKSEATHYAVNQYGGFMMDTLWEGSVNTNNSTVNLVNSYENYDYLYLLASYTSVYINIPVFVKQIVNNVTYFGAQVFSIGSVDTSCRFLFTSNTALRLTNSVGNISINKVIGVRGSVPSIIEGGAL